MRALGQAMHWLNDPANEKAVTEVMMQRLKIDDGSQRAPINSWLPRTTLFVAQELSMLPG